MDGDMNDLSLHPIEVSRGIWLHSARYVLPAAGLDVSAPLPVWAVAARDALSAGFTAPSAKAQAVAECFQRDQRELAVLASDKAAGKVAGAAAHVSRGLFSCSLQAARAAKHFNQIAGRNIGSEIAGNEIQMAKIQLAMSDDDDAVELQKMKEELAIRTANITALEKAIMNETHTLP